MKKLLIRLLTGSRPGVLFGLGKVHKETKNGLPPFRPIFSTIGTPAYKLAKFLLPFLTPLTQDEYTVTDSFHFAEEICKQDLNLYMTSLDVDSLFTNIPFTVRFLVAKYVQKFFFFGDPSPGYFLSFHSKRLLRYSKTYGTLCKWFMC